MKRVYGASVIIQSVKKDGEMYRVVIKRGIGKCHYERTFLLPLEHFLNNDTSKLIKGLAVNLKTRGSISLGGEFSLLEINSLDGAPLYQAPKSELQDS